MDCPGAFIGSRAATDSLTARTRYSTSVRALKKSFMIKRKLKDQLRLKTNLGYNIEVHPYHSLPRYEVKAKRFKDLRKHG